MSDLTDREEYLCRMAGSEGAKETFRNLGVDVDNPKEAQQDFAFMRRMRVMRDKGSVAIFLTLAVALATGIVSLAIEWLKK